MSVRSLFQGKSPRNGESGTAKNQGDVITRKDTARRLEVLEDIEQAGIGWIWASDAEGRLIYLTDGALEKLDRQSGDVLGQKIVELFETDPDNPDGGTSRPLNFQLKAHNKLSDLVVRFALEKSRHEVKQTWWSITAHPKFDDAGNFQGYRGNAKDITVEYERKLIDTKLAEYDSLTGLANRHYMNKRLENVLAAYKTAKRACALLMLDLDKFKQVNDTMGHPAGDAVLVQAAERLRSIIGDRGEVGRLGGDEFQIIIPDIDDRGTLGEIAEKIIKIVSQPYPVEDDKRAVIGTSVGIAVAPYDGVEREELVKASDLALYAAKNGGRGQYRFYNSDLKDEEEERQALLDDLRLALAAGELELHYQPVVSITDNTVVCMEALMRWQHEERGFVSPDVFIPVAEDSDLINQMGEWALRQACNDAKEWPSTVRVAVNVSAVQFANKGLPEIVANALAHTGLSADRLELELTESVFLGDTDATEETFKTLKGLGIRLALDDFGTGYSSLSYLRSAPFDKIKVDRSFVDSCTEEEQNSAKIIAAIVGLSNALSMETTVEGVEAFDQLEVVRSKGATLVQGWLYAKAMPQEKVLKQIDSGSFKIEPEGPDRHRQERRSVFRRIGVIHEDHRYNAVMRDLSTKGSRIEGLAGVPTGTPLVLDLGAGQLVVCEVRRSTDAIIAVEFETPLVSDGAGGLVTRHRVSPYALAAAGMPLTSLPNGSYPLQQMHGASTSKPQFLEVQVGNG
ncbi:putative bifunctional diguanylate cyclase/phosphodiesterase [Parerythrobacter jejuensis]|uniref:EAL domain-containing protein n=1 Tax=Parerythrobacter jejuensis TaxID=795812 RepID=A0A845ASF7_9SPHN|nr:EAL domain-containing protein [Parerythrobacter jejuensis]MXP32103.1 EAL domain-containing protein [Parerythrobacter jejuensis]